MSADLITILLKLGSVFVLILINAFFVAAEFALVSVRPTRIDQLIAEGNSLARTVRRAMNDPNRFISAAQIGITMASLALGWVGEPALAGLIGPLFQALPAPWNVLGTHTVAGIIAYSLITFLHIVLGEQVPKMIALERSEATILMTAQPTHLLALAFRPVIALLYWATAFTLRPLGISRRDDHAQTYSVDELRMLVASSRQQGELAASEEAIVNRALFFADITADQVMVPRTELVCVASDATPQTVLQLAAAGHARLPVYRGTIDNIIGVLHTKDLFKWLTERTELTSMTSAPPLAVTKFMRPVLTVPESITADALLAELKRRRTHVAIIIDEFGGTAGLVTLEDLMERLVGDVRDEFESSTPDIQTFPDGSALLDGLLLIEDVNERFGLAIDDPFNNTIGGHIFAQLGRKPEIGDIVTIGAGSFTVAELDGLRIARLRFQPGATPATLTQSAD